MEFGGKTNDQWPMTNGRGELHATSQSSARPWALGLGHSLEPGHWALGHCTWVIPSVLRRFWIERVPQPVAEEVQRKERERKEEARENQQPGKLLDVFRTFFDQHAEGTHRRLHAEAEETQHRLEQHHTRHRSEEHTSELQSHHDL